jgi:hypothetical protein
LGDGSIVLRHGGGQFKGRKRRLEGKFLVHAREFSKFPIANGDAFAKISHNNPKKVLFS